MSKFPPLKLRHISSIHIALLSALWMVCFSATNLNGQSVPEAINYQAIVRDASTFLPISDQGAYVSVEFIDGPDGDVIYQEEFPSIQTGKAGLINLSLGQGNPLINSFSEIPWDSGEIWLRLSVDVGNGLNILQETPFNTVPYAFYANSSGTSNPDGDGDSTNELIEGLVLEGTNLIITEGDQTQTVDLNSLLDDEDADPSNEIQSLSLNGAELSISGIESTVDLSELPGLGLDSDTDPSNELQELELVGNSLTISNSPSNSQVDLSPYLDNTDNQTMTLDGTILTLTGDPNPIDLSELPSVGTDDDADPLNEIQDLNLSGNELSITNNPLATPVDLSAYLDNTDSQDLTLSGTNLTLSGDATPVDLSSVPGIGDDADADPENELQDIELSGNELSITNNPLATPVDLSVYLDNTDSQDLTLSGTTLTLSGDATPVDLSSVPGIGDDADADPENELQDIELSGNELSITNNPLATPVDLSAYLDNTDSQDLTLSGTTLTLSGDATPVDLSAVPGIGDDADADPENELQDIELSGNELSITNNPLATPVDLSVYLDNTDSQDLTLSGTTLTLSGDATPVDLSAVPGIGDDADADPENELQDIELSGNELSITNNPLATPVDLSTYLDNTDSQDLTLSGTTLTLSGDATPVDLSTVPGIGDDADADPENELQDIELSGNELSITNNPLATPVDLSTYLDNTDSQDLTLSGTTLTLSGDATPVDLSAVPGIGDDADADPTNELQNIESTDGSITVTPNGNDFDLSVAAADGSETIINDGQNTTISGTGTSADPYSIAVPDNLDNDATNEIQDISTDNSAGNISLSDGSTITLNVNDADADPENELQDIELSGNELSITNNPLATPVDLSAYLDNTDNQDLTLSGTTLTLSGDATPVDLSTVPGIGDDADADPTNEIQDLSLAGSTLTLSGDGTTVDLSSLPGLGDDADADPSNEIQDLSLAGSTLSLSGDGTPVDLSPFDQSDLSQGYIFIGNGSDKASEVEVFGDLILDDTGETKVSAIMGTDVSGVPPTDGQILVYNATDSEWQPQSPASVTPSATTSFYSIDPLDFRELTDNLIGVDLDVSNALKFFDDDAPFAMLRDEGIIEIMAPIHLPHGSTINNLKVYFRDSGPGNMRFSLYRKDMTNYSVGNEILTAVLASGPSGDRELDINITNANEVDNSIYSYRLYVRFTAFVGDNQAAIDEVEQRVYGAVIEYTTN